MSGGAPVQQDGSEGASMDGLVDRLDLVEEQPLAERAASYSALQERLRARLEGADSRR